MIWLILVFIFVIFLNIVIWTDGNESIICRIGQTIGSIFMGFLASMIVLLIASGIFNLFLSDSDYTYSLSDSTNIIALKDNQNVSGRYFIFSGYIDEKLYYYYAKETEFGYKTDKVAADECYIKYTNSTPKIETYTANFTNEILWWFAGPIAEDRIIIYCPENTITTEFNINLE